MTEARNHYLFLERRKKSTGPSDFYDSSLFLSIGNTGRRGTDGQKLRSSPNKKDGGKGGGRVRERKRNGETKRRGQVNERSCKAVKSDLEIVLDFIERCALFCCSLLLWLARGWPLSGFRLPWPQAISISCWFICTALISTQATTRPFLLIGLYGVSLISTSPTWLTSIGNSSENIGLPIGIGWSSFTFQFGFITFLISIKGSFFYMNGTAYETLLILPSCTIKLSYITK